MRRLFSTALFVRALRLLFTGAVLAGMVLLTQVEYGFREDNHFGEEEPALIMPAEQDCMICHRAKPSHGGMPGSGPIAFSFDERWKRIAH